MKLLTIDDINEIPRTCSSFRPVYGNASASVGAESLMTYKTEQYVYVAAINYQTLMPISAQIPFADLGIDEANVKAIKELWTGSAVTPTATGFQYSVPASDARIYRIEKNETSGIQNVQRSMFNVQRSVGGDLQSPPIYDLQGREVHGTPRKGLYIVNGKVVNMK